MTTVSDVRRELGPTLALALPITVGQVSQMLIGFTDTAFIARLGTVPLAAAAFTQGVFNVFYVVCVGLLVGPGIFATRDHGAGDDASCASWLRHGRVLALVVSLAAFAVLTLATTQFDHLGQPPEVIAIVRPFFLSVSASLVPALIFQVQRQFAESVGRAWGPMIIIVLDVGLNAFCNWVLVFGHFGFPALGLVGSGYATLLARGFAVLTIAIWLRFSPHFAALRTAPRSGWERARFVALVRLGAPAGVMLLFETGAFGATALMMGRLGAVPLAAHQLALSCAALTFTVPLGISLALSLRVSRAHGEGSAAVRAIAVGAFAVGLLLMLCFAGLYAFGGEWLSNALTSTRDVSSLAAQLLLIAAIFQIFDGAQVIGVGALRGLTDVRVPAALTFAAYWLLSLPLGYFLAFHTSLGPRGLWVGLAAGLAAAAIALVSRLLHKTRGQLPRGTV
ncbi:MAG TPA: MATE family efflux transporter [Polyangiaceae bacterium]|nr:MATE family efflux transporter [Polyangiaceae bacterium]